MNDTSPSALPPSPLAPAHEPAFNIPAVVMIMTLLLAGIFGLRSVMDAETDWRLLAALAFVPARISLWLEHAELPEVLRAAFGESAARLQPTQLPEKLRLLLDQDVSTPLTVLSYGLLHGSFSHLLTNGFWLVAFGSPVARRLGATRFLILLSLATMGGAIAHWFVDPLAIAPLIGASAAVSGTTAAAARFVFAPGIRFGALGQDEKVRAIRAESFMQLVANPRALAFIGFWFAANFLFGSGVIPVSGEEANIAWQAHIGGFVVGLMIFPLLDRHDQR